MNSVRGITIRQAAPKDAGALLPLVRAYRAFYEQAPDPQREREFIEGHLRKHTSAIYVAEANGAAESQARC